MIYSFGYRGHVEHAQVTVLDLLINLFIYEGKNGLSFLQDNKTISLFSISKQQKNMSLKRKKQMKQQLAILLSTQFHSVRHLVIGIIFIYSSD